MFYRDFPLTLQQIDNKQRFTTNTVKKRAVFNKQLFYHA
ncbi:hypothetical protein JCM19294_793 [Nonlabens tegetincola]|uniref:Uncharacterized protein n=1 Tax=Nonlabens tegetincola TaxID=323273 RepID=A0A090Q583_9FLAO|nr:hypothetical protein JCM19294_793 [Nonlabens tegetincola]